MLLQNLQPTNDHGHEIINDSVVYKVSSYIDPVVK